MSSRISTGDGSDVSGVQNTDGSVGARFDSLGRRRIGTTTKPTFAVGAGAGAGATGSVTGTDEAGKISVTTAGTPAAGILCTLTFAQPFNTPPVISVDAGDSDGAGIGLYATATTTVLTVSSKTAAIVAAHTIYYQLVGGA